MADAARVRRHIPRRMTIDEFFAWQAEQDINYELVDGVPVPHVKAMTGASDRHDRVTVNVIGTLFPQLRGTPCRLSTADKSVMTAMGTTRRPDVIVESGTPELTSVAADRPRVVIEVLSPSTTRYDRVRKLVEYQATPAIDVILLMDTERPRVTVFRRGEPAWIQHEVAGLDATIDLPEVAAQLPLAELYEGLPFDE